MKRLPLLLVAFALLGLASGCGHVDLTPEGNPNRVVTGTVNVRMNLLPPPDSQVVVRLVEPSDTTVATAAPSHDLVIGEQGTRTRAERVVAEQVIRAPSGVPVPFRIEFRANDALLRRGLNIEARISWSGRVRFRTLESQVITLQTIDSPQAIWVEPVQ
ncbi:MAG TPA: YbaY family lipoprotein [Opitutaceae bacterium]|nr:YbaY family lipoprotein [Opitutaceae bacterium]